ncbi:hypothetical protein PHAVU_007G250400 [Phaseolus vulgaris]|uniref:SHSP domain-containing protein n=2 Tax=Phaseolus vulgaris TaxID=3885 RepID=V7BI71_PHAVU|nr:hypothetical protein PHAVU_007G250400g [Phaseolus vulgaris]ESW17572.1 hypothetical protein PHAVU_007G250400g [Phaseolus vulgaris]
MAEKDRRSHEAGDRVYQDFEPFHEWAQDEEAHTLILMLKGFRKENLRVQIGTNRRLKVRGEEQISENKWRRINKEFVIPPHSSTNGIKAKLQGDLLYIRIPKSITEVKPPTQPYVNQKYLRETKEAPTQEAPKKSELVSQINEMRKVGKDDKNGDEDRVKATTSKAKEVHETIKHSDFQNNVDNKVEKKVEQRLPETLYGLVGDIIKQKKLPNLVVAIFLFLGMGMYVKHAIKSTFGGSTIQEP